MKSTILTVVAVDIGLSLIGIGDNDAADAVFLSKVDCPPLVVTRMMCARICGHISVDGQACRRRRHVRVDLNRRLISRQVDVVCSTCNDIKRCIRTVDFSEFLMCNDV